MVVKGGSVRSLWHVHQKCVMRVLKDVRILWVRHERRKYGGWKMCVFLGFGMKDVLWIEEIWIFQKYYTFFTWSYVFHAKLNKYVRLSIHVFTSFKQNPHNTYVFHGPHVRPPGTAHHLYANKSCVWLACGMICVNALTGRHEYPLDSVGDQEMWRLGQRGNLDSASWTKVWTHKCI